MFWGSFTLGDWESFTESAWDTFGLWDDLTDSGRVQRFPERIDGRVPGRLG